MAFRFLLARFAYFGINTLSITWITPFDWYTSAMVTLAMPPFSSVKTMELPLDLAVSIPPATCPLPPAPVLMLAERCEFGFGCHTSIL